MKSTGTQQALSGLRKLFDAARAFPALRKPFREEMRQRAARAIDSLGESKAQLGVYGACDPTRADRWRDDGEEGIAAPWWFLAVLPPTKFRAALAFLEEWHREIYGADAAMPTREELWFLTSEAMSELEAESSRALRNDGKIRDDETPSVLPRAFASYRRLRTFIAACGADPDADGAS